VITKAVFEPFFSRSALVPIVVPILITSISSILDFNSLYFWKKISIPFSIGSEYELGFSDNNFIDSIDPLGFFAIISVKVPPLSTQNCHLFFIFLSIDTLIIDLH